MLALLVIVALNGLLVYKYANIFLPGPRVGFYTLFHKYFQVSGFDNFSHITVSNGRLFYALARHPLYAAVLYPLYWLNEWLMRETGTDWAMPLLALVNVVSGFLAYLFIYKGLRLIVSHRDALLLTWFYFSFAYIMLTLMVPDHFCLSLMLLAMAFYYTGRALQQKELMNMWQVFLLFVATAGISLTNGAKIWAAELISGGRKSLTNLRRLVVVFLLGPLLLASAYYWQYEQIIVPQDRQVKKIEQAVLSKNEKKRQDIQRHQEVKKAHSGKALAEEGMLSWTDISTSRWDTAVENLFGESIQLHRDYLLGDTLRNRPVFVSYRTPVPYIIEGLILLLTLVGIWKGRREKLLWVLLSWFALDMFLHMGLGFGINEIYIMTAHWSLIIPVAIGYGLTKETRSQGDKESGSQEFLPSGRIGGGFLVLYLWLYNGWLIVSFFLEQIQKR